MITELTTMGAEIELAKIGPAALRGLDNYVRYHTHNDGSLRDATYLAGDIPIHPEIDERGRAILSTGMREQAAYGLEMITEPYAYADMRPISQKIAHFFGHMPQNSRTSIHIHVDAGEETWKEVQHLFIWARALEAIIFRIACGGQEHRGCQIYHGDYNDHKFARPLSAPIGIAWDKQIRPLIDWHAFVNAKSASELVAAWGRLDLYWGVGLEHYMPHRLHFLNLAAVLRQGTIEWRVFDGMYRYFDILVDFVYSIHRLAGKGDLPDFSFDLGTKVNVDVNWVNNLLDMDVGLLWGSNWQKGCARIAPMSHYNNNPTLLTLDHTPVRMITSQGKRDVGQKDFVLYSRKEQ